MKPNEIAASLKADVEQRRLHSLDGLDSDLGQHFTPMAAAELIAETLTLTDVGAVRILDPGAGIGSLTAALVARLIVESPASPFHVDVVELDGALLEPLEATLQECAQAATDAGTTLTWNVINADYIDAAATIEPVDLAILNPPYAKLRAGAHGRRPLGKAGPDCANVYSTFLAVTASLLKAGGQLAAITPRSFANGPYHGQFRSWLLDQVTLTHIHSFDTRGVVFADTKVLQETVVFAATKAGEPDKVVISTSRDHQHESDQRIAAYTEVVHPNDPHRFIRILANDEDTETAEAMANLPATLADLGLTVSTGKVVDFRVRGELRDEVGDDDAPLLYPANVKAGRVEWPRPIGKPQGLGVTEQTAKQLVPSGHYVLIKRFSAKEERRRVVAAHLEPAATSGTWVAIENHVNYIHSAGAGFDADLAAGLTVWLNSTVVDRFFRTFSGHTQVNATDVRTLRFPSAEALRGLAGVDPNPNDQERIDEAVAQVLAQAEVAK